MQVSGADAVYKVIMQDWLNIHTNPSDAVDTTEQSTAPRTSKHTHCAAVQDDFHWWHSFNDESEHSGKLMMVDTSFTTVTVDCPQEQVIQVMIVNFLSTLSGK